MDRWIDRSSVSPPPRCATSSRSSPCAHAARRVMDGCDGWQVRDVLTQLPEVSEPLQRYAVTHAAELTPDVLDALGLADGEAEDLAL